MLGSLQLDQHSDEEQDWELLLPGLLQLTSLELSGFLPNLQLPTSFSCRMAEPTLAGRATSSRGMSAAGAQMQLPKLQRVSLGSCTLSSTTTLLQLSSLTGITELSLHSVRLLDGSAAHVQQLSGALSQLLQQLPHLHSLSLSSMEVDESALAPLSTMRDLQVVSIGKRVEVGYPSQRAVQHPPTAQLLASLPSSLAQLFLADCRFPPSLPTVARLSCLQKLELYNAHFDPGSMSVLDGMVQLQQLIIDYCNVLKDDWQAAGLLTAALLTAVGQMQGLKRLSVNSGGLQWWYLPAHSFTVLTGASELECLEWESEEMLPLGAVAHMFPEGKQLPHLHTLSLATRHWGDSQARWMTAADLNSIIAACPALERLNVAFALQRGEERGLLMLPAGCTHLSIGGNAMDASTVSVVTQLTQLRSLAWENCLELTDLGLEQLTGLRALTSLCLRPDYGLSHEVVQAARKFLKKDADSECLLIQQDGHPISKVLRDLCDVAPAIMARELQQYKQEVVRLQQLVMELQEELQHCSSGPRQVAGRANLVDERQQQA